MNVNKLQFNNSYNCENKKSNSQTPKSLSFGVNHDIYITSNPDNNKQNDKSKKRKRNLTISAILGITAATIICGLYFNGKKVQKSLPKTSDIVNDNPIQKFQDALNNPSLSQETIKNNIVALNNLIKEKSLENNTDLFSNIIECMGKHYKQLINLKNVSIENQIENIENYCKFLETYFEEETSNERKEFEKNIKKLNIDLINKKISESGKDIDSDTKILEETLKNEKNDIICKKHTIIKLLEKYKDNGNNIDKILETINNNTDNTKVEELKNQYQNEFKKRLNNYNDISDINNNAYNIIEAIQYYMNNNIYPKDNDNILQKTIVGDIEDKDSCQIFDSTYNGLLYGLGVCRHRALLVMDLINNSENQNIKAIACDNSGPAWNYLRFKKNDGTFDYYKFDIHSDEITKLIIIKNNPSPSTSKESFHIIGDPSNINDKQNLEEIFQKIFDN